MSQAITDKTFAILYWNEDWDWVSEKEARTVEAAIVRGDKFVVIDGELSMIGSIARVIKGPKMEAIIRRKNGDRQCSDCGRWLPKGFACGCQGGKF